MFLIQKALHLSEFLSWSWKVLPHASEPVRGPHRRVALEICFLEAHVLESVYGLFLCKAELKVRVLSGLLAVAPLNSCQLTRSLPCAWLFQAQIKIIRKMGAVQTTVRWQAAWTGRIGAKAPGNCEIPYIGGWVKRRFFSRTCDMTVIYFAPKTIPLIVLNNTT